MENVHFVKHQGINSLFDVRNWKEVTGRIDHESSPFEIGLIVNCYWNALDAEASINL